MKSYQNLNKRVLTLVSGLAIAVIIALSVFAINLNHKLSQTSSELTKVKKQNDNLAYDNKLKKDDYKRVTKLQNKQKENDAYTTRVSASEAAESGAKSSTVVINGSTFNSKVASDALTLDDDNVLYQASNTSNLRYFAKDYSATNQTILNLRVGDKLQINNKSYHVILNQTFTDDNAAAETFANDSSKIAIFFIRDASGYADMITASADNQ